MPVRPARTGRQAAITALTGLAGLAVGALTSLLQARLNFPWLALVNAASPWLVAPFLLGACRQRPAGAALAGLACCVLEVAGYYLTAGLRGYSGGLTDELIWSACALAGGPLFGAAGWLWRSGPSRSRLLGAAALPAAFLAEGLLNYAVRLHYASSAALFTAIAAAAAIALGLTARPGRRSAVPPP